MSYNVLKKFSASCNNVTTKPEKLNYWKRDKKYDALAASLKHRFRRKFGDHKIHRLHSAQRRWERERLAAAEEALDNLMWALSINNSLLKHYPALKRRHLSNHSHRTKITNIIIGKKKPKKSNSSDPVPKTIKLTFQRHGHDFKRSQQLVSLRDGDEDTTKGPEHPESTALDDATTTSPSELEETTPQDETQKENASKEKEKENEIKKKEDDLLLSPYSLLHDVQTQIIEKFPHLNITTEVLGKTVEYNDILLMKVTKGEEGGTQNQNTDTGTTTVAPTPAAETTAPPTTAAPPDTEANQPTEAEATPKPDQLLLRSDTKYDDIVPEKKIVFIVHGLSVMGFNLLPCMRTQRSVLELYSYYFKHLDKFDLFIMPMANPDGVSTSAVRPFWNKNVSPQEACPGVALDRNFDVSWDDGNENQSSCSQQYSGKHPFSEAETKAIKEIFHKYGHKMIGYIHVHAGTYASNIFKGDSVLYPRGYQESSLDDDKYIDLRGELDEALKNATFKIYTVNVDTLYNFYGEVHGTSVDYAAVVYGVPFGLEFVMQLYEDTASIEKSVERETHSALTESWSRVIDVTFNFMHKYMKQNEDRKSRLLK